ncbi:MAG: response regulator [Desulfobacterales bacterium]|jgi:CheY-like chemotaxis protein|nr:response regulator [Desulfobacterales bacterium]
MTVNTIRETVTPPEVPGGPVIAGQRRKRALVVDDNLDSRVLVSLFLRKFEFDIAEAGNGQEAFNLFRQQRFDVVVTDLQMPVMDGLTLMGKIKAVSRKTPVVVMTGCGAENVQQLVGMTAAADVLHKPFGFGRFKDAIETLFNSRLF